MRTQLDPVRQIVELDNRGFHATSDDNNLFIQIAAKGGVLTNLRAVLLSNDHASDRAYIQYPGNTTGRGICLVAGDSVLLVRPTSTLRYQGQLSAGLMY